jgi:hypothetical protein
MSYLGTKEDAKRDIQSVEPYNEPRGASSPGLMGGSGPGTNNKLSGETMKQRKKMDRSVDEKHDAHKGDSIVRKME